MEALGVVARLANLNTHDIIHVISDYLQPIFPSDALTLPRRFLVTWLFLYVGSLLIYFFFGAIDYLLYFRLLSKRQPPMRGSPPDIPREIRMSVLSLAVMSAMSTPAEVAVQLGYGKVYYHPAQYGYLYLAISPFLFLAFSDFLIYFIHRGLHHPSIYKYIHKPHHSFINTSPFAAFAFHPMDGYMQGMSYQVFIFFLPFHSAVHLISLVVVSCWTINIHDRITLGIPGVNGAAHHTIHHTTFKSNYGQYTTVWDRLCGTYRDPVIWQKSGSPELTEKQVYGKSL